MNKLAKKTLSLLISGAMAFSGMTGLALAAENDFAVSAVGSADGSITSITTVNAAAGESAGVGIVAVYTEGMLKGLAVTDSSAVVTAGTYDLKAPLAYNVVSDTYQAFVWNSLNEQKPLTEVYSSSVPEPTVEPTTPPTEGPTTEPTVPPTTLPTTPPTTLPTTEPTTTPTTPPVVVPTVNPTPTPAPVMYTVTVAEGMTNGSVAADKATAAAGEEVTLTVTPAEGYMLDTLTVTDAEDGAVVVTDNKFTMPAKNVTVNATFKVDPNVTVEVKSTYVDASSPDENYSASDVRYANAAKVSEGILANNGGGQIAILDFDASEYVGKIRSATVSFTATCQDAGKNSQVRIAKFAAPVDTATATWNTVTALEGVTIVNEDVGYADDKGTPLTCDITNELRAAAEGKMSLAVYTYTARKQALTDIKVNLVVEPDVIPQTTVTVNKVVQGTEPAEIIETNTYDVYVGDAYTATYDEIFETIAEGVKTAYYKFAGVAGIDDTIASLSETADQNVITLPYAKTAYQTVTFTAALTDAPKAGVPIKVNGTPTVTGTAIEERILTTDENGTVAINLLPGSYSYAIDPTAEYLAVDATPFVVENVALPISITLTANQKAPATLKVVYTTDGTADGKVSEKVVYDEDASKFDGDEVAADVFDAYTAVVKVANEDGSGTYKVYNYASGKPADTTTLSAGENVVYLTVTVVGDYYYYEDFSGDATGYTTSTNGQNGVTSGGFLAVVQSAGSGGRYFTMNFNGISDITESYVIEMDLSLRSAQSSNNGDSQFALLTEAASNKAEFVGTNYLFTLGAHMQSSVWTLGAKSSADIDSIETKLTLKDCAVGSPYKELEKVVPNYSHVKMTVDPASETAALVITDTDGEVYNGTVTIEGTGRTVKGMKFTMGRQNGGMAVDNIKVYPSVTN